ncbi:cobalamin B12-binding domain-containing protein [Candidatus Formimonas warabiya]|uniref:Cobalamin-binding protein n=1 Tax=Formimonas warabiya TaxID=1761012 RepID=A0A3G1KQQ0_FORW1|nr:cobalamin-dependent protein [Candidatus Formimonas warabiya]ATW24770.1 hypothetical protein DCMF_08295 [Candidatus Formimonas warabiya]
MDEITKLLVELKEKELVQYVQDSLDNHGDPMEIINSCQTGMEIIGEKFRDQVYFLPELLIAADLFKKVMLVVTPKLEGRKSQKIGKIVLGTVKGDLHDIGKNIFKTIAEANGFEVIDLGVDVPAERFLETLKNEGAQILAMSGLLTTIFGSMKSTVENVVEEGLRAKVKVIIGGAPIDENVMKLVGADAFSRNASEGVDLCKKLLAQLKD